MSNIVLNTYGQKFATKKVKEFVERYNTEDLTQKGRREMLEELVFFAFLYGYKCGIPVLKSDPRDAFSGEPK